MQFILSIANKVTEPHPSAFKNELDREIVFRRNRTLFLIFAPLVIIFTLYAIIYPFGFSTYFKYTYSIFSVNIIFFCCICRKYPNFFSRYFILVLTFFGPFTVLNNDVNVIGSFAGTFILPLWALYLGGTWAFMFEVVCQGIFLNTFYKTACLSYFQSYDPIIVAYRMISVFTLSMFTFTFLIISRQFELTKAYQQITEAKMRQGELERQKIFLLSFSHELRNLINAAMGNIQLVKVENISVKIKDLLQNSELCCELLLHHVNNILDSGKVEIGELEITPSVNNINEVIEKIWGICSLLIKSKGLIGQIKIQNGLPPFMKIDNYRLIQILMNLIGNAIKFTERGKVTIDINWIDSEEVNENCFEPTPFNDIDEGLFEKEQAVSVLSTNVIKLGLHKKKIQDSDCLGLQRPGKGILKIVVSDTGNGIKNELLPSLFNKFSQVNEDKNMKKLGTGLGLFITKQLVERMGGEIKAYSKPGKGTVFIACIPTEAVAVSRSLQNISLIEINTMIKSAKLDTLVVDDVEFNRIFIINTLKQLGVNVSKTAENGLEAFEKFKANVKNNKSFDIVTMDVYMPVMDGKTSVQLIREYEVQNNMEPCMIVMVSGNCSESEIAACVEPRRDGKPLMADHFLKKPSSMNDFLKVIKSGFENRRWEN